MTVISTNSEKLGDTLNWVDALSQEAFGQIEAVSKTMLAALENPSFCRDTATMAKMFKLIMTLAQQVQENINYEADQVGCGFVDEHEALAKAMNEAIANVAREASNAKGGRHD